MISIWGGVCCLCVLLGLAFMKLLTCRRILAFLNEELLCSRAGRFCKPRLVLPLRRGESIDIELLLLLLRLTVELIH